MKENGYVLLGPPGSGKGTQAANLVEALDGTHLSTGELLRAAVEEETELGRKVEPLLSAGQLVPTRLLLPILEEAFATVPEEEPVIFDGFPRRLEQAIELDKMLARHDRALSDVFLLDVPREELFDRLLGRGRADDRRAVIEERLDIYQQEIEPLRDYYEERDLLRVVDGTGAPEEVTERLLAHIGEPGY
ncbi:MAG: adenylate kinase [Chloroflexota bacterium]|nr:adenylate kinase [Chloroflexota bacterium]